VSDLAAVAIQYRHDEAPASRIMEFDRQSLAAVPNTCTSVFGSSPSDGTDRLVEVLLIGGPVRTG